MSKYALLLSLGHNSSAIALKDGQVLGGYETERMSKIKSDSAFPYQPINELYERFKLPPNTDIYVSHWFIDAKLPEKNKYWDPEYISSLFPKGQLVSVSQDFTHHDAHAWSSVAYMGNNLHPSATLLVADGFGNFGECISIYQCESGIPHLVSRLYGFGKSLGMFYQYATAYMGMKMHNHEYKILGYETHILEVCDQEELDFLNHYTNTNNPFAKLLNPIYLNGLDDFDPLLSLNALINTQANVNEILDNLLVVMGAENAGEFDKRVIISYFVQKVTEDCIKLIADRYNPKQLVCSGGLFYNVKINKTLAYKYPFEVIPIAGDQGAAIGLYHFIKRDFIWPNHLYWGHRDFWTKDFDAISDIICCDNDEDIINTAINTIARNGFVNLVRGAMEFGPRSLCHTATLALPSLEMVAIINELNDRTDVMPMAPVVTESKFYDLFEKPNCTKSFDYMIVAAKYKQVRESYKGAAHYYPISKEYTGRPQINRDPVIDKILNHFGGILINTSFNVHGVPIVYDAPQVIHSHLVQASKNIAHVVTIVKTGD